jgi:hypothetical protein
LGEIDGCPSPPRPIGAHRSERAGVKETPEREVKLAAPNGFTMPDLNGAVDGPELCPLPIREVDAVYYDTADLRLTRWGLSLHHCSDDGWTVKPPTGRHARR